MRSILFLLLGLTFLMAEIVPARADGSFIATGSLSQPRRLHTATLLPDGRVLVCGGIYNAPTTTISLDPSSQAIASAEIYDPGTGTWSLTAPLQTGRWLPTATLLQNGTVLVTGGYHQTLGYLASSEIYDPATGSWTRVGDMQVARNAHSATLLQDGRVLVAGGVLNDAPVASVEIYDPTTRTWSAAASMAFARTWHSASLLADGRVLVMGGWGGNHGDRGALRPEHECLDQPASDADGEIQLRGDSAGGWTGAGGRWFRYSGGHRGKDGAV